MFSTRLIRLYYSDGHVCCSVRPFLMTAESRIILRHCHRNSYAIENPPLWSWTTSFAATITNLDFPWHCSRWLSSTSYRLVMSYLLPSQIRPDFLNCFITWQLGSSSSCLLKSSCILFSNPSSISKRLRYKDKDVKRLWYKDKYGQTVMAQVQGRTNDYGTKTREDKWLWHNDKGG